MWKTEQTACWKEQPNRDQVLERSYEFVDKVSQYEWEQAAHLVRMDDPVEFKESLESHLNDFVFGWLEDDEANLLHENLFMNLYHPADLQEEWVHPEFQGSTFVMKPGERFSIHLSFFDRPTPLRLTFAVCEEDALFFLKVSDVSVNPNLPSLDLY